jgi:hypothetical protein
MSLEQIFEGVGTKISDVRPTVNGWPASVDADLAPSRIARLELFELSRVGVKEAKGH